MCGSLSCAEKFVQRVLVLLKTNHLTLKLSDARLRNRELSLNLLHLEQRILNLLLRTEHENLGLFAQSSLSLLDARLFFSV